MSGLKVHAAELAEALAGDHPLAQVLTGSTVETDAEHRPVQDGEPMITLAEAAQLIGS